MNRLKSLFVSFYIMLMCAMAVHSLYVLVAGGSLFTWIGALVATAVPASFFAVLMLSKSFARTSANLPVVTSLTAVGAGLSVYGYFLEPQDGPLALAYGLAGFIGWLAYDYWYSRLGGRDSDLIAVGNRLPDFDLQDDSGNRVNSLSFRGSPALLLFYRGNWCPFCMAQVGEIAGQYRELAKRGVNSYLISPQPAKYTDALAKKFDAPLKFLVDGKNEAARKLGIDAKNGTPAGMEMMGYDSDTVLPTVIICDAQGKIIFSDQTDNYRVRPEPDLFLQVIDAHHAKMQAR